MNNPTITYFPFSAYTVPVYPVYNDQTILVTSSTSSRFSYKLLSDVYINGQDVATLKNYPFNGVIEVNPQNITMNYLLHDFNYSASPINDNYDSVKSVYTVLGEEYSRTVSFSSITAFGSLAVLNTTIPTICQTYDMVQVNIGNQSIIGEVVLASWTGILTNIPLALFNSTGSGTTIEGSQYFDYDYNGFHTVNPHNFNVGDTVLLQMNSWSTGTIIATGGTSGSITQISVGGFDLMASSVPFTTNLATTMSNVALEININYYGGYSAYVDSGSEMLHIYSNMFSGAVTNGLPIVISSTGSLAFSVTPSMYINAGYDSNGEGWNPQLSGQYTIASVPTSTSFITVEQVTEYYNNQTGAERGMWYDLNNYVFTNLATGGTYYVMNNGNYYLYPDYATEVATHRFEETGFFGDITGNFLTNKPRTSFEFYSNNDIETVDILYPVLGGDLGTGQTMHIQTYSGNNQSYKTFNVNIADFINQFTVGEWKRYSLGVGAWNLNNISSSLISPSGQTVIDNNVTSYQLVLESNRFFEFAYTETLTFNRQCSNYDYYQLIFLNKWGAFDYMPLNANFENDLTVARTQFDRKRESIFNASSYGVRVPDRGKTDFYINSDMQVKLYSDWLTLDESNWLMEVYESPQVYLYCPNDASSDSIDFTCLYPINIIDTEIRQFNQRSRMKQFVFTALVSNQRINQKN